MAALKYRVNGEWHTLPTGVSYEVGDIFISTNATSPAARFGGTWTQLTDRFLVGAGSSYAVGATGGANTVRLTDNQIPSHAHNMYYYDETYTQDTKLDTYSTRGWSEHWRRAAPTVASGGGAAHENRPPYLAVYMWLRTA